MDQKVLRAERVNFFLKKIASCGRRFFRHKNLVSHFEIDDRGRIWFIDAYAGARIYTAYTRGRWRGFSEGGTLRALVIALRDYIRTGTKIPSGHLLYPEWFSDGDPWGYGEEMKAVVVAAVNLQIMDSKLLLDTKYVGIDPAMPDGDMTVITDLGIPGAQLELTLVKAGTNE